MIIKKAGKLTLKGGELVMQLVQQIDKEFLCILLESRGKQQFHKELVIVRCNFTCCW